MPTIPGDDSLNAQLAFFNAAVSLLSGVCIALGLIAVRRNERTRHRRWMLRAIALQSLFAAAFVIRLAAFGMTPFDGRGLRKVVYTAVIVSHEAVAVVTVPLVLATVAFAWTGRLWEHREIARFTYPIWLFATASGVAVYVFLYW